MGSLPDEVIEELDQHDNMMPVLEKINDEQSTPKTPTPGPGEGEMQEIGGSNEDLSRGMENGVKIMVTIEEMVMNQEDGSSLKKEELVNNDVQNHKEMGGDLKIRTGIRRRRLPRRNLH